MKGYWEDIYEFQPSKLTIDNFSQEKNLLEQRGRNSRCRNHFQRLLFEYANDNNFCSKCGWASDFSPQLQLVSGL